MTLAHEFIEYTNDLVPVKWIIHGEKESVGTVLPHWHTSFEVTFIYAGRIDNFTINNVDYPTDQGSIFLINSAEVHGSVSSYCRELEALTIQIPYEFMKKLLPDFEYLRVINYPTSNCVKAEPLEKALADFYLLVSKEPVELLELQLIRLTYEIIYIIAKDWMHRENVPINSNLYNENLGKTQPIISYIHEHYHHQLTVQMIADNFHFSTNYLSKFFKKSLGMSVMKYVQLVRLNKAHRLLLYTDKPIHVISDMVGFPSEKSFRKTFEEAFHQTPKKYQMEYKEKSND